MARAGVVLWITAVLIGLYAITGRHQRVWPFPSTDRMLFFVCESIVWIVVGCVVVFFAVFGLWVMLEIAGWKKRS